MGNGGTSAFFGKNIGLKQGYLLGSVLFSLYVNDLEQNLTGGSRITGIRIKILLLMAENSRSLQDMTIQL